MISRDANEITIHRSVSGFEDEKNISIAIFVAERKHRTISIIPNEYLEKRIARRNKLCDLTKYVSRIARWTMQYIALRNEETLQLLNNDLVNDPKQIFCLKCKIQAFHHPVQMYGQSTKSALRCYMPC